MDSSAEFLRRTFALDGRVALVTGASSGLGAHMAGTLARAGCKVALAARRSERLEAIAESIANDITGTAADTGTNDTVTNATVTDTGTTTVTNTTVTDADTGGTGTTVANTGTNTGGTGTTADTVATADIFTVRMDVRERDEVEAGVERVVARFGRLDILVNNAGIAAPRGFLDMTEAEWRTVVDTDLSAVWRVGQVAARRMTAQKTGGVIINIASILGISSQRAQANYGAAKAGVLHLTRNMARELAHRGVRVNALAPGYFATDMNREFFATERGRDYLEKLLPRRPGELHELDGALLLLASDAGSYITGSTITVDGGALLGGL